MIGTLSRKKGTWIVRPNRKYCPQCGKRVDPVAKCLNDEFIRGGPGTRAQNGRIDLRWTPETARMRVGGTFGS